MKIIQFGEGNFLRAFVEWIAQQMNYSVAIVKPRPGNTLDALRAQGCRYHVNLQGLLNGKTIDTMEEITCVTTAVNPYEDHEAFLALAEDAEARFIVSNTTEAGITFLPAERHTAHLIPCQTDAVALPSFSHLQQRPCQGLYHPALRTRFRQWSSLGAMRSSIY